MKKTCLVVLPMVFLSVLGCVQANPSVVAHSEQPFVPLGSADSGGNSTYSAASHETRTAAKDEFIDWEKKPMIPVKVVAPGSTRTPAATPVRTTSAPAPAPATRDEILTPRTASSSAGGRQHEVRRGDTLYRLAREYYGNESRWRDIYDANRATLRNADTLAVGSKLVIP